MLPIKTKLFTNRIHWIHSDLPSWGCGMWLNDLLTVPLENDLLQIKKAVDNSKFNVLNSYQYDTYKTKCRDYQDTLKIMKACMKTISHCTRMLSYLTKHWDECGLMEYETHASLSDDWYDLANDVITYCHRLLAKVFKFNKTIF